MTFLFSNGYAHHGNMSVRSVKVPDSVRLNSRNEFCDNEETQMILPRKEVLHTNIHDINTTTDFYVMVLIKTLIILFRRWQ